MLRSTAPHDFSETVAICVAAGQQDQDATDTDVPPEGTALYYLVRAWNIYCDFGAGTLGASSAGVPRTGRDCP